MQRSAHRAQETVIRGAAVVQGLALVVVPTVSTVLTGAHGLALSATAYGTLFVPQTVLAVIGSFAGSTVTRRWGPRASLALGFTANLIAMACMTASAALTADRSFAYAVLLVATSFLGVGFALTTPTLNLIAASLATRAPDRAVLIVNALLGGSAAVAPVLFILFVGFGWWWGLPLLCGIGMLALWIANAFIRFERNAAKASAKASLPARLWVFAGFALLYGICEQVNASWAPLYMTHQLAASATFGSIALTGFWAVATAARVVFALIDRRIPSENVFRALPFLLALTFVALAALPAHAPPLLGVAAFALAGLGVSALLPLVLSFAERAMPDVATSATGVVFAAYLVGYGAAAFGVGPLQHWGMTLAAIDALAACIACAIAALAFAVVRLIGDHA